MGKKEKAMVKGHLKKGKQLKKTGYKLQKNNSSLRGEGCSKGRCPPLFMPLWFLLKLVLRSYEYFTGRKHNAPRQWQDCRHYRLV